MASAINPRLVTFAVFLASCAGGTGSGEENPVPDARTSADANNIRPDAFIGDFYIPPEGVCSPSEEFSRDRFEGDSQLIRDSEHVRGALRVTCFIGEDCLSVEFQVSESGNVSAASADEIFYQECTESTLLGLCLPTLAGQSSEESICGV